MYIRRSIISGPSKSGFVGAAWLLSLVFAAATFAQTTEFTYQGSLKNGGVNANGSYDFIFALFDAASGGSPLGSQLIRDNVPVTDGLFVVNLDFGVLFPGANRFLQISVRQQPNIHTQLSPRQQIKSVPYSIKSLNAENSATSTNSLQLGGVAANQFVLTGDSRLSDARNPLPGSQNYIQNSTPGGGFGFNINGMGSAEFLNAGQYFSIGNIKILSTAGIRNLLAGQNAGAINSGADNSFFGNNAGQTNQSGARNSFFGSGAGRLNSTAGFNSFFGADAGSSNTTGASNTFVGNSAGLFNTTGGGNVYMGDGAGAFGTTVINNTIVGAFAGFNNTGSNNTFVGNRSGSANTTSENSFFGAASGQSTTSGAGNSFFGSQAGQANTTGFGNSFFGSRAGVGATSGNSNSFFGSSAGAQTTASGNSFFGASSGAVNTTGSGNRFFGGGINNTTGFSNSFFGGGNENTTGNNNTFIGVGAGNPNQATQVSLSTAIGFGAVVSTSNTIVIGRTSETTQIPGSFTSGFFDGPFGIPVIRALDTPAGGGVISPNLYLTQFNQLASSNHLCWRAVVDGVIQGNAITNCSGAFTSERYKSDLQPFTRGLDIIKRLQPMAFKWKADGSSDIGLSAEDVAEIEPSMVTRDAAGKAENVNEHSLDVLLINAIKEQQSQIEAQQKSIRQMQQQIDALKALVCIDAPNSAPCTTQLK